MLLKARKAVERRSFWLAFHCIGWFTTVAIVSLLDGLVLLLDRGLPDIPYPHLVSSIAQVVRLPTGIAASINRGRQRLKGRFW